MASQMLLAGSPGTRSRLGDVCLAALGLFLTVCSPPCDHTNGVRHRRLPVSISTESNVAPDQRGTFHLRLDGFPAGHPWAADGRRVVIGSEIWDGRTGAIVSAQCGHCCGLPTWPSGSVVVFDCGGDSLVFDVDANTLRSIPNTYNVEVVHGGRGLSWLSRQDEGQTRVLWDIDQGAIVGRPLPSPPLTTWLYSDDGETALSIAPDGEGALVRLATGERTVIADNASSVDAKAFRLFSADSTLVAIPRRGDGVRIVDLAESRAVGELTAEKCKAATSIDWSADGSLLAEGTDSGNVCVFEVATRQLRRSWRMDRPHPSGRAAGTFAPSAIAFSFFTAHANGIVAGLTEELSGPSCGQATVFDLGTGNARVDLGLICRPRPAANGAVVYEQFGFPTRMLAPDLTLVPNEVAHLGTAGEMSADGRWMVFPGNRSAESQFDIKATAVNVVTHRAVNLADLHDGGRLTGRLEIDPTGRRVLGEAQGEIGIWDIDSGGVLFSAEAR